MSFQIWLRFQDSGFFLKNIFNIAAACVFDVLHLLLGSPSSVHILSMWWTISTGVERFLTLTFSPLIAQQGTLNRTIVVRKRSLLPKVPFFETKKKHFEWPNQNSKTTLIVQTFPKYGLYGFDLVNLSLLGAILSIFQFCRFSGLFWPFFPCKKG